MFVGLYLDQAPASNLEPVLASVHCMHVQYRQLVLQTTCPATRAGTPLADIIGGWRLLLYYRSLVFLIY
jgi:hypothetical protein